MFPARPFCRIPLILSQPARAKPPVTALRRRPSPPTHTFSLAFPLAFPIYLPSTMTAAAPKTPNTAKKPKKVAKTPRSAAGKSKATKAAKSPKSARKSSSKVSLSPSSSPSTPVAVAPTSVSRSGRKRKLMHDNFKGMGGDGKTSYSVGPNGGAYSSGGAPDDRQRANRMVSAM